MQIKWSLPRHLSHSQETVTVFFLRNIYLFVYLFFPAKSQHAKNQFLYLPVSHVSHGGFLRLCRCITLSRSSSISWRSSPLLLKKKPSSSIIFDHIPSHGKKIKTPFAEEKKCQSLLIQDNHAADAAFSFFPRFVLNCGFQLRDVDPCKLKVHKHTDRHTQTNSLSYVYILHII